MPISRCPRYHLMVVLFFAVIVCSKHAVTYFDTLVQMKQNTLFFHIEVSEADVTQLK